MTNRTALTTYAQALALQERLTARAMLRPSDRHEIVEEIDRAEFGSVWVRCSCGHWTSFRSVEAERGEALYVAHVAESLRATLAVAA